MVTVVGKTAEGLGVYRGLSTDLPLVPAPKNGSRFFAMDNGKTYWYDEASDTWEGYAGGGGGLSSGYIWLEDVTITNSNTTDDCATRLKDLADEIVSYCAALPDDEIVVLTHFNGFNYELIPLITKAELDNTTSSLNFYAERNDVSNSLPGLTSRTIRCSTTAANNTYYALTIKTDGTMTLTDNSSSTISYNVSVHLNRFKKI